ncbi:Hypothetical protein ETEE_0174 [Edwardsiella anguillarum ET080813]|uniref:Uncharacterized protein n=1 Tax=Edwardsiella anguillarum ET080813 TaxID=667120 RepID=A0A076LJB5_9GAMM|nr:Hypothetical protein ETEE_0174 [Edwardsiella anguillarum ET080813]
MYLHEFIISPFCNVRYNILLWYWQVESSIFVSIDTKIDTQGKK